MACSCFPATSCWLSWDGEVLFSPCRHHRVVYLRLGAWWVKLSDIEWNCFSMLPCLHMSDYSCFSEVWTGLGRIQHEPCFWTTPPFASRADQGEISWRGDLFIYFLGFFFIWQVVKCGPLQMPRSQSVYTDTKDGKEYNSIIQNKQMMCSKMLRVFCFFVLFHSSLVSAWPRSWW